MVMQDNAPKTIYRIHIRPSGNEGSPAASFKHCVKKKVLGMGWSIKSPSANMQWEEYIKSAMNQYSTCKRGVMSNVIRFKGMVKTGDLVWTRDTEGIFYLARVTGEWQYKTDQTSKKLDMVNVRKCEMHRVGSRYDVQEIITSSFMRGRTLQRIKSPEALEYSKRTWVEIRPLES